MPDPQAPRPVLPPEVRTERLVLRRWQPDDVEHLTRLYAQPEFWWYPFGRGLDADDAKRSLEGNEAHWERHGFGPYAVTLADSGRLIGYIGLKYASWFPAMADEVEVGWRLDVAEWGNGYATEGGRLSLEQAFGVLRLERVICIWEPDNKASGKVAEKLGMHWVRSTTDPQGIAIEVMELGRDQWQERFGALS